MSAPVTKHAADGIEPIEYANARYERRRATARTVTTTPTSRLHRFRNPTCRHPRYSDSDQSETRLYTGPRGRWYHRFLNALQIPFSQGINLTNTTHQRGTICNKHCDNVLSIDILIYTLQNFIRDTGLKFNWELERRWI